MAAAPHSRAGFGWIIKMAWRDARSSTGKLTLFMASIVLGIAAVVSIQSFGETLKTNIALQSKSLMGADFKIDSDTPINDRVVAIIDSLGGADARETAFASMAAFPGHPGTKLMQVRGIEGGFPFYGTIETEPSSAAQSYQEQGAALVDATILLQFGLKAGDSIKLGNVTLPIAGALKSVPGSNAVFSSIAAPVLLPFRFIEQTGLVQTGSRIDYVFYFKDAKTDLRKLDDQLDRVLDAQDADLNTHISTSERLGKRYENFGKFLNLVAFIALLLGCVGIASAIHIYIRGKLPAIAVLKCIGATQRQTFLIFLVQIAFMGLLGGILGTGLGLLLQQLFPYLLQDLLPIDVAIGFSGQAIALGLLLGVVMSVLFALYPLIGTLYVSPLQALRVEQKVGAKSKRAALLVGFGILLFILLFSFWLLRDWRYSLAFLVGIVVTFALLGGVAQLFVNAIRRYFPSSWGFTARQSLLNLFRPQNQTLILVLAIGVGSFLISTLYFTKDLLLSQATLESNENSPNLILFDVQRGQMEAVAQKIASAKLPVIEQIPIVTMKIASINGTSVEALRKDTASTIRGWVFDHEFRTTYRDSLISSETIQEGTFTPSYSLREKVPISISDNLAEDAQVGVGDPISFNVQGVLLNAVVGNIRTVDWSRMQLNFSIVFPEGVLEEAPQFGVITTQVPDEAASAKIQQTLVQQFPNVSILDLRQVLTVIQDLLDKIGFIINFMAFFSIFTGVVVLLGAVRTSKYQRIRESVLLRTLGARSRQILRILALEYTYLGLLGALSGILLSLVSSLLLGWLVFDTAFVPSLVPFLVLLPGIVVLVLLIGLGNSVGVLRSTPLEVLRREG